MAKSKKSTKGSGIADTPERVAQRMAHLRSGAAGVHADQRARRDGAVGRTNRQGSRSARRDHAIKDSF